MAKTGVNFGDLLDSQKKLMDRDNTVQTQQLRISTDQLRTIMQSNDALKKLDELTKSDNEAQTNTLKEVKKSLDKGLKDKSGDGLNSNIMKMAKSVKETNKLLKDANKDILEKSRGQKEFKSIGQRVGGIKEGFKDFFTMRGFLDKTGISKRGSGGIVGNMLDANEAAQNKAKARIASGERGRYAAGTVIDGKKVGGRAMSAEDSEKQFKEDAKKEQRLRREQGDLERKIAKYKESGLNDTQISQTKEGRRLNKLAGEFAKVDPMNLGQIGKDNKSPKIKESSNDDDRIKAGPKAPAVDSEEVANETAKIQTEQSELLKQIEENTRPAGPAGAGGSDSGGGSGILAGIGKGLGALGGGLGKLGTGIGKGIKGVLVGLAEGIVALGTAVMSGVGAVGLASLAGIILTIAAALRIAAPAIEAFAPVLMKLAEQIGIVAGVIGGVLIEGIKAIPAILGAVGGIISQIGQSIISIIEAVTSSIERLANIDAMNLMDVGAGLLSVSAGLAAFGAGQAVAGVGNLVGGLLGKVTGQKSPVDQLEQIAAFGPNLNQAGTGVKNLAKGLSDFNAIDPKKIKEIASLPTEKIAAMGVALSNANAVYDKSGKNKEATMAGKSTQQQSAPVVVSAPTTINKTNQQGFFNTPIRNQDNTLNSYLKSRYM